MADKYSFNENYVVDRNGFVIGKTITNYKYELILAGLNTRYSAIIIGISRVH